MKDFFDVFPKLNVKTDLRDYFAQTQIERLTTNKERTRIKVVLHSDHLIHKKRIYRMQEEISKQVFGDRRPEIYIDEHYTLSAQYTPRRLMEEYHDSLVEEIGSFNHVMGLYFREAGIDYKDDGSIRIAMEDTCLSRKMSYQLEEALCRIFRERCGVPAEVTVSLEARRKKNKIRPVKTQAPLMGVDAAFTIQEETRGEVPPWEPAASYREAAAAADPQEPKLSFVKKEEASKGSDKREKKWTKNGGAGGAK